MIAADQVFAVGVGSSPEELAAACRGLLRAHAAAFSNYYKARLAWLQFSEIQRGGTDRTEHLSGS